MTEIALMLENYQNTHNPKKMIKIPPRKPKKNDYNTLETYKMTKMALKPIWWKKYTLNLKDDRNTVKPKNDQNTPKWPKYSFL